MCWNKNVHAYKHQLVSVISSIYMGRLSYACMYIAPNIQCTYTYSYALTQLLTDEEFQELRIKQACAHLQPTSKRGLSRDAKLLLATEEERLMTSKLVVIYIYTHTITAPAKTFRVCKMHCYSGIQI